MMVVWKKQLFVTVGAKHLNFFILAIINTKKIIFKIDIKWNSNCFISEKNLRAVTFFFVTLKFEVKISLFKVLSVP